MANSIIQFHSLKENSLYVCSKAEIPPSHTPWFLKNYFKKYTNWNQNGLAEAADEEKQVCFQQCLSHYTNRTHFSGASQKCHGCGGGWDSSEMAINLFVILGQFPATAQPQGTDSPYFFFKLIARSVSSGLRSGFHLSVSGRRTLLGAGIFTSLDHCPSHLGWPGENWLRQMDTCHTCHPQSWCRPGMRWPCKKEPSVI